MRLNTNRIWQSVMRFAGRAQVFDPGHAAVRSWQVGPAVVREALPAAFLEGDLDKIISLSPWRNRETEDRLIRGGTQEHAATWAHELRDVTVFGPFIYAQRFKQRRGNGPEQWYRDSGVSPLRIDEAAAATSEFGAAFFGTLLRYDFPLALLCESVAPAVSFPRRPMHHADGYWNLCKLSPATEVELATIDSLVVFIDFAESESRGRRYDELRSRLRSSLGAASSSGSSGVYIRRGSGGEHRHLMNETEVERLLVARGFQVIDPDTMTAEQIARMSLEAQTVVAVEGSHISHCIYSAARDATLLVLQPPRRFSMCYKEFADCAGQHFAFLVCDDRPNGFSADLDRLQRMLDRIAARPKQ